MKRSLLLVLLIAGCAAEPSRIEDGDPTGAPYGYYEYCARINYTDPICSWIKR